MWLLNRVKQMERYNGLVKYHIWAGRAQWSGREITAPQGLPVQLTLPRSKQIGIILTVKIFDTAKIHLTTPIIHQLTL